MVELKDIQKPIDWLMMRRCLSSAKQFRGPAWPNLGEKGVHRLMLYLYQWEVSGRWIRVL
jgi:hypothetical protein